MTGRGEAGILAGMKRILWLVVLAAACSKPPEEATVKKEEMKIPRTTAEAATGQTPEESVAEAAKVAAAAQANLDEKGEGMQKDE
ncbi:MAG: hypothetical protein FD126_457 [Elusimicrobia bacterium]|nr:MAG: hypothetical protein FD126_457 [Elusimicrobiota bacterium]